MKARNVEYFKNDHLAIDLKGRALRGAGVTSVGRLLAFLAQMLASVILARLLVPADFGLVAMVTAFSMVLMDVGMLGLSEAIIQAKKIDHEQISALFWLSLGVSLALAMLFAGSSSILAVFYKEPRVKEIAIVLSVGFVLRGMTTQHLALLKRNMEFSKVVISDTSSIVLGSIVAITLALQGFGYWALVARRLATFFFALLGSWIFCRWTPDFPRRGSGAALLVRFGLNNLGSQTINYFTKNVDKILLGWRFGEYSLGSYDRAYHLFLMPFNQLTSPISSVAVSALSKIHNEQERYKRYFIRSVSIFAFLGMAISGVSTVAGKDIVLALLGPQWKDAGDIFRILGVGVGVMLINDCLPWIHLSIGRADRLLRWSVLVSLVRCGFVVAGLYFGPLGVAAGLTASFFIMLGPGVRYAGAPIDLKFLPVLRAIYKFFLAAVISGTTCLIFLYGPAPLFPAFSRLNVFLRALSGTGMFIAGYALAIGVFYKGISPARELFWLLRRAMPNGGRE